MLKLKKLFEREDFVVPAAFGRLRVETISFTRHYRTVKPAAFGRLRVETQCTYRTLG